MDVITANQFRQIFNVEYSEFNVQIPLEEILGLESLDVFGEVPRELMDQVFSQLSLSMFCCGPLPYLSEAGITRLLHALLTPVICHFAKAHNFSPRRQLMIREMAVVETNSVLYQVGIKKNGKADLVLSAQGGLVPFLVFEIKRLDITLAYKQNAVYMKALLMKHQLSKVSS